MSVLYFQQGGKMVAKALNWDAKWPWGSFVFVLHPYFLSREWG